MPFDEDPEESLQVCRLRRFREARLTLALVFPDTGAATIHARLRSRIAKGDRDKRNWSVFRVILQIMETYSASHSDRFY